MMNLEILPNSSSDIRLFFLQMFFRNIIISNLPTFFESKNPPIVRLGRLRWRLVGLSVVTSHLSRDASGLATNDAAQFSGPESDIASDPWNVDDGRHGGKSLRKKRVYGKKIYIKWGCKRFWYQFWKILGISAVILEVMLLSMPKFLGSCGWISRSKAAKEDKSFDSRDFCFWKILEWGNFSCSSCIFDWHFLHLHQWSQLHLPKTKIHYTVWSRWNVFGPGVQQAISDPTAPLKNHWKEQDSWREMERQAAKVLMEHQREAIHRYLAKGVGSVET